jgi:NAD(P)-dependent dehydrogenase (short-subunit alcohol dehydrogenase family)
VESDVGELDGRVAIVTGAGSGIGRAIALRFADAGATVVAADVSGRQAELAAERPDQVAAADVDVSVADQVRDLVALAVERWERLDVMVNNAGFGGPQARLHEYDDADFDRLIAVNLKGVYHGLKYALAAMLDRGGGSIINVASAAGLVGWPRLACYAATKGGVVQLTRSAALEYAKDGIRVNAICPGITLGGRVGLPSDDRDTRSTEERWAQWKAKASESTPLGRWSEVAEQAAVALFLASDAASFMTGVAVPVDGGYVAG